MIDKPLSVHDLPDTELISIKGNIDRLCCLEKEMEPFKKADVEIIHHFAPGVYAREMRVPAGVMLTGKIHRYAHLNIMSEGDATIVKEDGKVRVQAPFTFISAPGTKRAFYSHSATVWTTIHPTDETDLEKLESELIAENYEDLIKCHGL